jgi:predicted metalloprotease with PDZ domain
MLVGSPVYQSPRIAAPIHYQLDYPRAGDSQVRVTLRLPTPLPHAAHFVMPRAIPMGYGTQPYDRFVSDLAALDPAGRPIPLTDLEGPRWLVESGASLAVATISYRVDLARMDQQILSAGDASRARARFLGLLGYSVFGFVDGLTDAPIVLSVRVPAEWPLVTTLAPLADSLGTATVSAKDYYALADAQIMAGPDLVVRRLDAGVPLAVASYAEGAIALDTIAALAGRALREAISYFGSAPFPHFTVALEVLQPVSPDHGYRFSMEHLESATFRFATDQVDLSPAGRDRFHYNLLHHIAHAWIPKRCAPAGYYPFTWDYAAPIDAIWFSEGWAQYAAADIFARDRPDAARVLRAWAGRRFDQAAVDTAPPIAGRGTALLSTVAAHQYSDDFRISQTVFARGGRMAEAIDQRIRAGTGGAKTFRDVARALMAWCATASEPVTAEILERVVRQSTSVAARDLIDHWLAARGPAVRHRPRP